MSHVVQPSHLEIDRHGLGADPVDFEQAWALQRNLHDQRVAGQIHDVALFVEHPPVYTAGKRTEPHERPVDGTPVIDIDRGGKITFHGPGQLVGYPIVRLPDHVYVVDYLRRLEEAVARTVLDLGVPCGRVKGRSGVWLAADRRRPVRKIAALGIRVARKVTMHGFALNCDVDLDRYASIVPCGITDAGVTSLSAELGRTVGVNEAADALEPHLRDLLAWADYERTPDLMPDRLAARTARAPEVGSPDPRTLGVTGPCRVR